MKIVRFSCLFRRLAFGASVGLAMLAGTTPARADAESDAKDLFARAKDMRTAGDCAGAVPLLRTAYKVYPSGLGSVRNLAECEEQLGHYASARRAWLDIKRALVTLPADTKYDGWDKDAETAAARLKPKVATVFVDVILKSPEGEHPASEKSGVEVFVNGENLGTNLVGKPLERDPGTYRVRFVNGSRRRAAALWSRYTAAGLRSTVLTVPGTYPPEAIDGVMVSGWDSPLTTAVDGSFVSPRTPGLRRRGRRAATPGARRVRGAPRTLARRPPRIVQCAR